MKLSVLIPVYNERYLVRELVSRVLEVELPEQLERELVVVDDGSTDGTRQVLRALAAAHPDRIRYIEHEVNQGKGGAIRTAIEAASGELCIFQDADLEYDPRDYRRVLEPLLSGHADVVYGSRFLPAERRRVLYFWHSVGNKLLTTLSNAFTDLGITDMETCYKAFRTRLLKSIPIRSKGFGLEPEITAKVAKRGLRVYEVPISYDGRTYLEGKKIGWKDGFQALYVILKYWLIDDIYEDRTGHEILVDLSRAHRFNSWMARTIRPFVGHRVLEIGAGIGPITTLLLPRELYVAADNDAVHLEVLESLAARRPGCRVMRMDAASPADFSALEAPIDTVVCLNALEHVGDADAALANCFRALAPGGRLILAVPQGQWLFSPLDRELGHLRRYSRADLLAALGRAGFLVERVRHFNRVGVLGWLLNGKILRRRRMARLQLKAYDSTVWLWRRVDRLVPLPGLSLIAVARKPEA